MANNLRTVWQRLAAPLLSASPKQRLRWCAAVLLCGAAVGAAALWFGDNYRIAWDRQVLKCMDSSFLLVDLKDKELKPGNAYAFIAERTAPVIKEGTVVGKYLRAMPGDTVEIRPDNTVWINGIKAAEGMPHLRGMTPEQASKFYGRRTLREDEYWMMGTKYLSFDSRYWGPVHSSQIIGRSYELF